MKTINRIAASGMTAALVAICVSAAALGAWHTSEQRNESIAKALTGGNPQRAAPIIRRFGCGGCHTIPGIAGADGRVAPPLAQLRQRVYIGGVLNNSPDNLVRWIVSPQAISPHSAMPATGITEDDARHVAAFLYAN
jgi:cytochrome c1